MTCIEFYYIFIAFGTVILSVNQDTTSYNHTLICNHIGNINLLSISWKGLCQQYSTIWLSYLGPCYNTNWYFTRSLFISRWTIAACKLSKISLSTSVLFENVSILKLWSNYFHPIKIY